MKKFLSIVLVLALILSMGILPYGITASAETTHPENAFYDFTNADSTTFNLGEASTDSDGNEFYAFNYDVGNTTATANYELTEIKVGSRTVSGLKIEGYKDPTNSNICADGVQIIPTDENGGTDTYSLTYDPYINIVFSGIRGIAPSGAPNNIVIDYISVQKDVPSDGTVKIYNGDTLAETLEGLKVGDAFPAITIPEAPEGKYFAGLSLDPAGNRMLTSKTLEAGVSKLYYVFKDYEDNYTDNMFITNTGGALYPTNYGGNFYPTFAHRGWSAKGVTDGTFRFYGYNTWWEAGLTYATDEDGFAIALKPYSKYKMTVTYRSVTLANTLRFKIGYGLTPDLVTDLSNKGFTFNAEEIILEEPVNDWTTTSFEFETGSLNGIIPVAGVYANCAGLVDGVRSELQIQSINIERLPIEYGISNFEYNGGFKDYDMTNAPVGEQFVIGEEPLLPKTAYRYRYAFDGWFYDEAFTLPAGERYENGKTYYAKWVLYGDLDEDGQRNAGDLAVMKKHISGIEKCDSVAAEVTDDNAVNAADLAALKKKIAGLNSILGPTRYIALTFDDGPNQYFEDIVNSFNKVGGKATFFVITDGAHLNDNTKPYLQYAIDQGFEIGNHSMNHPNMQNYTDKQAVKTQMQSAWQRVHDMVGYDMKVARLPNFGINDVVIEAMNEMNLPMFGNAFVTGELDTSKTAEEEKQIILDNAFDGAVVCLHAMDKTASILDDLLAELHEDGYEFVTASDMFKIKGYDTIPLGVQHKHVKPYKKLIALTFDDGPNETMLGMTDIFKEYGGACTFFLIGNKINASQAAYLQHAYDNGCQLASHTFTHGTISSYTTKEEILAEFDNTNTALKNAIGVETTIMRLPGLSGNELIYNTCKEAGIPLIAGFGVTDWSGTTTTVEDVAYTVIQHANDGSIFVMHSTEKTLAALEIILPELTNQGYEFVTVDDLFSGKGYTSIPLGSQLNSAQQQY